MTSNHTPKILRIALSPTAGRLLGGFALIAMHGWFLMKLALPSEAGMTQLLASLAALSGMIASVVFFVSTYGVLANSPDQMLDERELVDRNRAYFGAFQYIVGLTLIGCIAPELAAKVLNFELSIGVMQNYLTLMFATAIVLPGALLAWGDRAE
jgi:hypothetical protein